MRPAELRGLLERVRRGRVAPAEAARRIDGVPLERLEFATLDHQRSLRVGFPEVVFGPGKTPEQLCEIARRLEARHAVVLATRVDDAGRAALGREFPHAEVHDRARAVVIRGAAKRPGSSARRRPAARGRSKSARGLGRVLVVCAGTADLPVAEEALITARVMGSRADLIADVGVAGLHRLLAHRTKLRGARVLVVVAGLEGALPSVVGGLTDRPLIAVPTSVGYGAHFSGLAPLLSMLNSCAAGVMVVNVDNGFGAGYAAHLINCAGRR
ncbi:MAG TPA: nickel pincer cofactor biosynthesis protein LarB [Candidatus Udaeobacter sp.]|jgi:NCAIR mutase (PurE)-related protein|nr:nickel pincer cofactor biosynthesis protein LarB [Candidatus Udaeobacter sp.]